MEKRPRTRQDVSQHTAGSSQASLDMTRFLSTQKKVEREVTKTTSKNIDGVISQPAKEQRENLQRLMIYRTAKRSSDASPTNTNIERRDPEKTSLAQAKDVHTLYDNAARSFPIADVLDFRRLSHELQTAKNPEDVYHVLHSLQREPSAISTLDTLYQQQHRGSTLENYIHSRFKRAEDKPRLEHALHLINKTEQSKRPVREIPFYYEQVKRNQSHTRFQRMSQNIHDALQEKNAEKIYATLTPLQRNTELLQKLGETYTKEFPHQPPLQEHIKQKLEGSSRDYALYLIGDQKREQTVLTPNEAMRIARAASHLTFKSTHGERVPVPFDYYPDGCYARAHAMSQSLKEAGYASEKIYAVAYHFDEHGNKQSHLSNGGGGSWNYHTAICIRIKDNDQKSDGERYVIDPTVSSRPQLIKDWLAAFSDSASFRQLSLPDFQVKLEMEARKDPDLARNFPSDQTYVLITNRNYYELPTIHDGAEERSQERPIPDQDAATDHEKKKSQQTRHADIMSLHSMVNNAVTGIHSHDDAQQFLQTLGQTDEVIMAGCQYAYPDVFRAMQKRFSALGVDVQDFTLE